MRSLPLLTLLLFAWIVASPGARAQSASTLVDVVAAPDGVDLVIEGHPGRTESFTLTAPPRLVVDLYGVERSVWRAPAGYDWGVVERVRVGHHPGRVRVVFDLRSELFDYSVTDTTRGVHVRIGGFRVPETALEELETEQELPPVGAAPMTEEKFQETLEASAQQQPAQEPAPPTNTLELTVRDAIRMALENNLSIEVFRTDPGIAAQNLRESQGAYDPLFSASFSKEQNEDPAASAFELFFGGGTAPAGVLPKSTIEADIWNYNVGFIGILPLGLRYTSSLNSRRTDSTSGGFSLDPDYRTDWTSELVLPLLRDFVANDTDIRVKRSRVSRDISIEEFRRNMSDEIQRVEEAYWELTAAIEGLRVAEKSLETARSLLEQTRVQYEVGVVSRVAVTQAISGLAQREVAEIRADNRADSAQDDLLNLVLVPSVREFSETRIEPESPTRVDYQVDLDAAVRRALQQRPEVATARQRVEDARLQLQLADNQRLPKLDLLASYTSKGIAGDAKDRINFSTGMRSPQVFEGGAGPNNALHDALEGEDKSWKVMAQFEFPLGNVSARSVSAKRRIEMRRARTDLRRTEQQVILETRQAARDLRSALDGIRASERGREAAAEALRAEQEKLRLGDSTPFQVLQFEEDLAEAENELILALQIYRNAVTALERAQGTLLVARGIRVQEELRR